MPYKDKDLNKIHSLLTGNGFAFDNEESVYTNDYLGVYPNYQDEGKTTIIDSNGNQLVWLPDNYYAVLGWLIENHILPFTYQKT